MLLLLLVLLLLLLLLLLLRPDDHQILAAVPAAGLIVVVVRRWGRHPGRAVHMPVVLHERAVVGPHHVVLAQHAVVLLLLLLLQASLHVALVLADGVHEGVGRIGRHLGPVGVLRVLRLGEVVVGGLAVGVAGVAWVARVGSMGVRRVAGLHAVQRVPPQPDDGRPLVGPLRVFLHMLGQVRLLRVRLAAVLTDVRFEVLGLLVLGDMLQQRRLVHEALVARVAFVRLVRLVAARVRLQVGQLREGLVAARVPALVRLVARVRTDVLLQVRQLRELALADLATVRLDAEMDPRVLRQVARVGERLGALRALVRLGLPQVHLGVHLQVRLRPEDLLRVAAVLHRMPAEPVAPLVDPAALPTSALGCDRVNLPHGGRRC